MDDVEEVREVICDSSSFWIQPSSCDVDVGEEATVEAASLSLSSRLARRDVVVLDS